MRKPPPWVTPGARAFSGAGLGNPPMSASNLFDCDTPEARWGQLQDTEMPGEDGF
ncbi:MAG: hypothetical protein ABSE96_01550 [Terracidiphilus sp.]